MKQKIFLICIFLFASVIQLFAQSTRLISCKVISSVTQEPLQLASIALNLKRITQV